MNDAVAIISARCILIAMEPTTIAISGFDSDGEPEIHILADGAIRIVFNFMPPMNGTEDGVQDPVFDDFATLLARALGVAVTWEDREVFRIEKPAADTAQRAKVFLETFWAQHTQG